MDIRRRNCEVLGYVIAMKIEALRCSFVFHKIEKSSLEFRVLWFRQKNSNVFGKKLNLIGC